MREGGARTGISKRDLAWLAVVAGLPVLFFGLVAAAGRSFFWGDLLYLHHPWKALVAQALQGGEPPLWNPYIYLGMPLAAQMQCAAWYPGSLPFYLFSFRPALALFHAAHYGLCGVFALLWLRRWGLPRSAAAGGALLFMLCGGMISRIPFLNHLSTLMFFPLFLLAAEVPALLALAFALSFLSGYPTMLAGSAAAAWLMHAARTRGAGFSALARSLGGWAAAAALGAGLSACLLFPAADLAAHSKRGAGMGRQEVLTWAFKPGDIKQLAAPPLIPRGEYSPTVNWWKTAYFGFAGAAAAAVGLVSLPPAAAAAAAAYLGGAFLLLLGGGNPVSAFLWDWLPPLRFVRYPGNMSYLLIPAVAWLAAEGLRKRGWARWCVLCIGAELTAYAAFSQPVVTGGFFSEPGPLVAVLRRELGGHRYLLSPLALHWHRGMGTDEASASRDLKQRLYGLTNAPYRLSSVGNFGEPLVPLPSYLFMDHVFSRPSLEAAARWLPWADAKLLMTRDRFPAGGLDYLGDSLWHIYSVRSPVSRALWFSEEDGAVLREDFPEPPPDASHGVAVAVERTRADRFSVSGVSSAPGWLYLSEPLSGWSVSDGSHAAPRREPVFAAFSKFRVPAGAWTMTFRYAPASWAWGLSVTIFFLAGLTAYWYNRVRKNIAESVVF